MLEVGDIIFFVIFNSSYMPKLGSPSHHMAKKKHLMSTELALPYEPRQDLLIPWHVHTMGSVLEKFPTSILTIGLMLPSVCWLSWLFDWSKLRMFTFQPLQGIPYLCLNLIKNIKRFNFIKHSSETFILKIIAIFDHF